MVLAGPFYFSLFHTKEADAPFDSCLFAMIPYCLEGIQRIHPRLEAKEQQYFPDFWIQESLCFLFL